MGATDPRVSVLHAPKPGSYAARNQAIARSHSEYVVFTDADCIPDPSWLKHGVQALAGNAAIGFAGGAIIPAFRNPHRPNLFELYDSFVHLRQEHFVTQLNFAATANMFARRALFDSVGFFDETHFSGGDREWGQRATRAGQGCAYVSTAIVHHSARRRLSHLVSKERRLTGREYVWSRQRGIGLVHALCNQSRVFRKRLRLTASRRRDFGLKLMIPLALLVCFQQAVRGLELGRLRFGGKCVR
jgi:GT2 family glycosyltransferase